MRNVIVGIVIGLALRAAGDMLIDVIRRLRKPKVEVMDVSGDWLEQFANASEDYQARMIALHRDMDQQRSRLRELESKSLEARWRLVPAWRRWLISGFQRAQRILTPRWFV